VNKHFGEDFCFLTHK